MENYQKNNHYQIGIPLLHTGTFIKKTINKNNQVSSKRAAFVFRNIGKKKILAIKGQIETKDIFNNELPNKEFQLTELDDFRSGDVIGEEIYFPVPKEAYWFRVKVQTIVYSDQSLDDVSDFHYDEFNAVDNDPSDEETFVWESNVSNYPLKNRPIFKQDYYQCGCGLVNLNSNSKCIDCSASTKFLKGLIDPKKFEDLYDKTINEIYKQYIKKSSVLPLKFKKSEFRKIYDAENTVKKKQENIDVDITILKSLQKDFKSRSELVIKELNQRYDIQKMFSKAERLLKEVKKEIEKEQKEKLAEEKRLAKEKRITKIKDEARDFEKSLKNFNTKFDRDLLDQNTIVWSKNMFEDFQHVYDLYKGLSPEAKDYLNVNEKMNYLYSTYLVKKNRNTNIIGFSILIIGLIGLILAIYYTS